MADNENKWNDDDDFDSDDDGDFGLEAGHSTPGTKQSNDRVQEQEKPVVVAGQGQGQQVEEPKVSGFNSGKQDEQPLQRQMKEETKIEDRNNEDNQQNRYERKPREDRNEKYNRGDRKYENNDKFDRGDRGDRGDRNQRNDRGNRGGREQQERKEYTFDPNSNFRKFYLNDPQFYQVVIRQEQPPYEFKIHLFLDGPKTETSLTNREITLQIMEKVADQGGKDIKEQFLSGRNDGGDKLRYTFIFDDQTKALECYNFFNMYSQRQQDQKRGRKVKPLADESFNLKEQLKIYLQKDEAIFEKYGDEEAQLYNDMQAHEQTIKDQRAKEDGPRKGDNNRRNDKNRKGDHYETSKEDAEFFNFRKGGPPKFQNKKKEEAPKNHDKDLRAVINEEKDKEHDEIQTYENKGDRQYENKNKGGYNNKQNDFQRNEDGGQIRQRGGGRGGRGGRGGQDGDHQEKKFNNDERPKYQNKKEYKEKQPNRQVFDDPDYKEEEEEKKDGQRNTYQRKRGGQQMQYQPKGQGGEEREGGNHQEGGRGGYDKRGPRKSYNNQQQEGGDQQQYKKKKQTYNNNQSKNPADKQPSAISKAQGDLNKQATGKLQKQSSNRFAAMDDDF